MGLFSLTKNKKEYEWKNLTSLDQLEDIEKNSFQKVQIIFKHSTTCSISRMAKNRIENGFEELKENADLYYLDLHTYRNVSNVVASKWNVEHESPQVLVIKNGKSVYDASHNMVRVEELQTIISN